MLLHVSYIDLCDLKIILKKYRNLNVNSNHTIKLERYHYITGITMLDHMSFTSIV